MICERCKTEHESEAEAEFCTVFSSIQGAIEKIPTAPGVKTVALLHAAAIYTHIDGDLDVVGFGETASRMLEDVIKSLEGDTDARAE